MVLVFFFFFPCQQLQLHLGAAAGRARGFPPALMVLLLQLKGELCVGRQRAASSVSGARPCCWAGWRQELCFAQPRDAVQVGEGAVLVEVCGRIFACLRFQGQLRSGLTCSMCCSAASARGLLACSGRNVGRGPAVLPRALRCRPSSLRCSIYSSYLRNRTELRDAPKSASAVMSKRIN